MIVYIGLLLVGALCVGGGGLSTWSAAKHIRLRLAMRRWPRVAATVVSHGADEDADSVSPFITVKYQINGRHVKADCKSPTRTGYALEGAGQLSKTLQRWYQRYAVGSTVKVMVNPTNDAEAYIKLPEVTSIVLMGGFGVMLLALPIGAIVVWLLWALGLVEIVTQ